MLSITPPKNLPNGFKKYKGKKVAIRTMLGVENVAEILNVSTRTVRTYTEKKRLFSFKIKRPGGRYAIHLYPWESVQEFCEKNFSIELPKKR